jgi:hypothetical protein
VSCRPGRPTPNEGNPGRFPTNPPLSLPISNCPAITNTSGGAFTVSGRPSEVALVGGAVELTQLPLGHLLRPVADRFTVVRGQRASSDKPV